MAKGRPTKSSSRKHLSDTCINAAGLGLTVTAPAALLGLTDMITLKNRCSDAGIGLIANADGSITFVGAKKSFNYPEVDHSLEDELPDFESD